MKKTLLTTVLLFCCAALSAARLNVKDFGAAGDGVTDDTKAIRKALRTMLKEADAQGFGSGFCPVGIHDQAAMIGVGERETVHEVFLPAGTYRISDMLIGGRETIFIGEEGTVIEMTDPEKEILYCNGAFRITVKNVTFRGGNTHILICTRNNESARVLIENCRFEYSAGAAVDCRSYRNPAGTDYRTNPLSAYDITWEGDEPVISKNDLSDKGVFNNSTLFICRNSEFNNCQQAFDVGADGASINDCRITAASFPAFRLGVPYHGHAYINNIHATAAAAGEEPWVENHTGTLAIRNSTFDGAPRALVEQLNLNKSNIPATLLISHTNVTCAGTSDDAIVRIKAPGITPCVTELFRVRELGSTPSLAIRWETTPTYESLLADRHIDQPALDAYRATLVEWPYFISFGENSNIDETLPDALASSVTNAFIPDEVEVPAPEFTFPAPVKVLKAADFGVDDDPATDDTAAMQKALAAVAEADGMTELQMPAAMVKVNVALSLPGELLLTAEGRGWIVQTTPERPIFVGENIKYFKADNFVFSGNVEKLAECGHGFEITLAPDGEAEWTNCCFYSMNHSAITATAGKDNSAKVRVADSTFMTCRQVLDTDAELSAIDNIWISSHGKMDEQAVIINRPGGNMRITNMLTVPAIMKYHYPPHLPCINNWPNGDNLRWVDNHGKLFFRDNRIGGEWMGFCLVYNWHPAAEIYMDGGISCCYHPSSKMNFLYCMYPPQAALIRNMGWKMRFPDGSSEVGSPDFIDVQNVIIQNVLY